MGTWGTRSSTTISIRLKFLVVSFLGDPPNDFQIIDKIKGTKCGMNVISDHGIVGRGVLLDYYSWALENGKPYDPLTSHAITVKDLEVVAKAQDVTFEIGDILLVRSGYTARYYELERENLQRLKEAGIESPNLAGVEQSEEMKEWLHDHYFAAVAGDAPAFEVWPGNPDWKLHEYLLALWGVLIGEMFDLEALSKQCKAKKRWSFLFISSPLNSPGGVASLANALAIH
jgi:kynurenine formamidase